MRVEVTYYLSQPYRIHQGYRTLLITNGIVIYINFKDDKTITFKVNNIRYRILNRKYKLWRFQGSIVKGIYND